MIGYAARALLSRTLQRILYKYLVDVDVQHLTLWHTSSWEFEVSNVKLREGVTITSCQNIKKRMVQKKRNKQTTSTNSDHEMNQGEFQEGQNLKNPANLQTFEKKIQQRYQQESKTTTNNDNLTDTNDTSTNNNYSSFMTYYTKQPNPSNKLLTTKKGYNNTNNDNQSSLFCRSQSGSTKEELEEQELQKAATAHIFRSCKTTPKKTVNSVWSEDENENEINNVDNECPLPVPPLWSENIEEEVQEVVEENTIIQLGSGGHIGTLKVKLEGKDLQITIKDANLVMEAITETKYKSESTTIPQQQQQQSLNKNDSSTTNTSQKNHVDSTKQTQTTSKDNNHNDNDDTEKENNTKNTTMGEKVRQANKLAKLLSSIPQLYIIDSTVRLIVKEKGDKEETEATTIPNNDDKPSSNDNLEDTNDEIVFTLGIDFLSVTNGEDFLAYTRAENNNGNGEIQINNDLENSNQYTASCIPVRNFSSSTKSMNASDTNTTNTKKGQNESSTENNSPYKYMTKRIRTGKGPEGGIWFHIFVPHKISKLYSSPMSSNSNIDDKKLHQHKWAWESFRKASSKMSLFRLSGLDIHAQILYEIDHRNDADGSGTSTYNMDENEAYTVDSMLFGFDYMAESGNLWNDNNMADQSDIELNLLFPIQNVPIQSNFYRIGQGLQRRICSSNHHPFDDCPKCWDEFKYGPCSQHHDTLENETRDGNFKEYQKIEEESLPLPGFIIHTAVTETIEINVTKEYLESLSRIVGYLKKFKSSKKKGKVDKPLEKNPNLKDSNKGNQRDEMKDSILSEHGEKNSSSMMQPENVSVFGLFLDSLSIRYHIINTPKQVDSCYSFCYWDLKIDSLCVDQQKLLLGDVAFQDTKILLDDVVLNGHYGACVERIFWFDKNSTHEQNKSMLSNNVSTKPHTEMQFSASSLLNIPMPRKVLSSQFQSKPALQLRWTISPPTIETHDQTVKCVHIFLGSVCLNTDKSLKDHLLATCTISKQILLQVGTKSKKTQPVKSRKKIEKKPSLLDFKVNVDGASISWKPIIQLNIPSTQFTGCKEACFGFILDTCISNLECCYGNQAQKVHRRKHLCLSKFVSLSEILRMRIFLYVEDLEPLQVAFQMKNVSNSFSVVQAFNKKLTKISKHLSSGKLAEDFFRKKVTREEKKENKRRKSLLKKIHQLDNDRLESLLTMVTSSANKVT